MWGLNNFDYNCKYETIQSSNMKFRFIFIIAFLFSSLFFTEQVLSGQDSELQSSHTISASTQVAEFHSIPDELIKEVDTFFKKLIDGKTKEAYEEFLIKSPIAQKKEDVSNLISQTKRAQKIYGKINGFEPVSSEWVTPSYFRIRYLGLNTYYPMRWIFTFYKSPKSDWVITNIKFDDLSEFFFTDQ